MDECKSAHVYDNKPIWSKDETHVVEYSSYQEAKSATLRMEHVAQDAMKKLEIAVEALNKYASLGHDIITIHENGLDIDYEISEWADDALARINLENGGGYR